MKIERSAAAELDRADALAGFKDRFVIDDQAIAYMDGNSLGRLPKETVESVRNVVAVWGADLVRGWDEWIDLSAQTGDLIASTVVGASKGEVIVADSTSINLYKLAAAALELRNERKTIITERSNFPSDLYVLESLAARTGMTIKMTDATDAPLTEKDLGKLLSDDVALVCLQHVNYRSGALAEMKKITDAAHRAGALMLWDLCHSAGVVPIDLNGCDVDLAVGCTYKYLNSGPGAPSFLFVRSDLQGKVIQPLWGWFGADEQFSMKPSYEPAIGIRRFLTGTPPVVSLTAVRSGVSLVAEAGVEAIRAKSVALTQMMVDVVSQWPDDLGVSIATPIDADLRGSHLAIVHEEAYRLSKALIGGGVIVDFREPDTIRFGVSPLYTTFTEAWDALDALRWSIVNGDYRSIAPERSRVT